MKFFAASLLMVSVVLWSCSGSTPAPEAEPVAEIEEAAEPPAEVDPDEQLAEMARDCAEAAAEIEQRQAERSLYERLGGRDGIRTIMVEMVDVHMANPVIKPLFDGVDMDRFIENSTDFLAAGAGGDVEYTGRDVTSVHERMNLTSSLFLEAGADLETAMQNLEIGPDEQQEVMCALVGLRDLVLPAPPADEGA